MHVGNVDIPHDRLAELCRRWQIVELSLFGSVVRDDFGPDSDVDVLVTFQRTAPWSTFDLVTLREELAQMLGRPVDLVEKVTLRNPFRRHAILRERVVVYAA